MKKRKKEEAEEEEQERRRRRRREQEEEDEEGGRKEDDDDPHSKLNTSLWIGSGFLCLLDSKKIRQISQLEIMYYRGHNGSLFSLFEINGVNIQKRQTELLERPAIDALAVFRGVFTTFIIISLFLYFCLIV